MGIRSKTLVKYFSLFVISIALNACGGSGESEQPSNTSISPEPVALDADNTESVIETGVVTLGWTPPSQNTNGSILTDLAGYKIYYGISPDVLDNVISISNPGLTSFVIENLSLGKTYYFSIAAMNSDGIESELSNIASKYM